MRTLLLLTSALPVALLAAPILAQDTADSNIRSNIPGEIIVTAQKRAQNLQDVPIAISAMSTDYLEKRNITSIENITGISPNLKVERASNSMSSSIISIRGGVQGNPQLYFEPSVGLYMDGIYIAKAQGSVFDVGDIERIEVLRGPQGTLYGRNAVAGAVNIVLKKPSGEFGGRLEGTYGNYDEKRVRGTLDLPRFGIFSVKLSGEFRQHDGYYDVVGNAFTDEAASLNSKSGMAQVRAEPSDKLTLDYIFDISDIKTQSTPAIAVRGVGPVVPFVQARQRPGTIAFNAPQFENTRNWGHALTVALDTGFGTLKSITAIRQQKAPQAQDLDGTPLDFAFAQRAKSYYRQVSEELQLTGEAFDDRLNYVLGAYFFDDKGEVASNQSFFFGQFRTEGAYAFKTQAWAGYAQADYKLTDRLTLTGGIRYTHERKKIASRLVQITAAGANTLIDLPMGAVPAAGFSKVSPTATLAYDIAPGLNIYARYAQGYRSGGFNATASSETALRQIYQPEVQDTYEIGLKSRLLDNTLQLNLALFQNELRDMQLSVFVPGVTASSILTNAGKARVRGIEIEATAYPTDNLTLQTSLGYLDSKYKEFIDDGVNVADNRVFGHAPKYTLNTSIDWTAGRWDFGKLDLIADYTLVSSYYTSATGIPHPTSPADTPAYMVESPGRQMLNARALLSEVPLGGNLTGNISVWGKNILNEKNPNFFIDFGASFASLITAYFPDPATYGVTLGINF